MNPVQMQNRCPGSKRYKAAVLENYKLVFVDHSKNWNGGVANIVPQPGSRVEGVVYKVSSANLAALDKSEGVGTPNKYYRREGNITVKTRKGTPLSVITYIRKEKNEPENPPSVRYKKQLTSGAKRKSCQLSNEYIQKLEKIATNEITHL